MLSFCGPGRLLVNQSFHYSYDTQNHALVTCSIFVDSSNSYLILDFVSTQPSSDTDYLELVWTPKFRAKPSTGLPSRQILVTSFGESPGHPNSCPTGYKLGGSMTPSGLIIQ